APGLGGRVRAVYAPAPAGAAARAAGRRAKPQRALAPTARPAGAHGGSGV
nr:hypothetical protein [Tanacetum cinerariifolium]